MENKKKVKKSVKLSLAKRVDVLEDAMRVFSERGGSLEARLGELENRYLLLLGCGDYEEREIGEGDKVIMLGVDDGVLIYYFEGVIYRDSVVMSKK